MGTIAHPHDQKSAPFFLHNLLFFSYPKRVKSVSCNSVHWKKTPCGAFIGGQALQTLRILYSILYKSIVSLIKVSTYNFWRLNAGVGSTASTWLKAIFQRL